MMSIEQFAFWLKNDYLCWPGLHNPWCLIWSYLNSKHCCLPNSDQVFMLCFAFLFVLPFGSGWGRELSPAISVLSSIQLNTISVVNFHPNTEQTINYLICLRYIVHLLLIFFWFYFNNLFFLDWRRLNIRKVQCRWLDFSLPRRKIHSKCYGFWVFSYFLEWDFGRFRNPTKERWEKWFHWTEKPPDWHPPQNNTDMIHVTPIFTLWYFEKTSGMIKGTCQTRKHC